ncbi:hypothetical protein GCM10009624_22670 [Gordonia sinesedis]
MDGTNPRRDDPALAPNLRRRRRSAWNPASWTSTPTGSSLAPNPGYRRPAAPGSRRFAPTEHLAPEAVAAYVDGELGMSAHMRATHHLAMCPECVAAIDAQMAARTRLRASGGLSVPADLLGQLSQIPTREIDMTGHGVNAATGTDATTDRHRAGGLRGSAARGDRRPGSRVVGPAPASAPAPQAMTRGRMNRWRSR